MSYQLYLTSQGATKLAAAAAAGGSVHLTQFVVGSGVDVDFSQRLDAQTLTAPVYQGAVESISPTDTPHQYAVACVVPPTAGGFTIGEVGLIDSDGTLIWVGSLPSVQKPDNNSPAAVDYRINCLVSVDNYNGAVTLVIDPNVVTATRQWTQMWVEKQLETTIPRAALELLYPIGYPYWCHNNVNPKPAFDALFGYETFWRRLQGIQLVAVQDNDTYINQPMQYLGQKGLTDPATNVRPHAYPLYTSYLFERYDPSSVINTVWHVTADKDPTPEGDSVTLTITANNIPDGQILNWTIIEGNSTTTDNTASGTAILANGSAVIVYQTTADDNLEDPNKTIHLTVAAPADLDLMIPILDKGHHETVVRISQSTYAGIVLDEYFKSQAGHYPTATDNIRFLIDSGVDIVAPDTAHGAIEAGSNWADGSRIIIENHGRILGRGGDGGRSAYWHSVEKNQVVNADDSTFSNAQNGQDGGTAVHTTSQTIAIDNYGLIAGGGGGGGGQGLFSGNGFYNMIGGGGTGGGAPLGNASPNEGTYQMYLADPLAPANKVPLTTSGNYLIITTSSARYYTNSGSKYTEMGSQYFATTLPQERWIGLELQPNTTSNKTDFASSNQYDLLIIADGGETKTLHNLTMSTSASIDNKGLGGNGVVGNTAYQAAIIHNATPQNILTNHGGDGGLLGENGQDGVLTEHFGISQSSESIIRTSAQGGQAGYIYQGNVTINNLSGGTTKGRTP